MAELETLKKALLILLSKYPIDLYRGTVPSSIKLQRFVSQEKFLKNESAIIKKLGITALQNNSITLDEVQKVINDTIYEHFQVSLI